MAAAAGANDIAMIYCRVSDWHPGCGSWLMAGIAGIGAANVIATLAARSSTIMTTETGANDFVMVNVVAGDRCPGSRKYRVASITGIAGINMVSALTAGSCAIVAGKAIIDETCVIYRRNL